MCGLAVGRADAQAVVKNFATPLEVVAWSGNDVIAEVLLRNGADPNFGIGGLPVDTASSHGNKKVFRQLIEAGADYTIENTIELGMVKETRSLIDADASVVDASFARGGSPLASHKHPARHRTTTSRTTTPATLRLLFIMVSHLSLLF